LISLIVDYYQPFRCLIDKIYIALDNLLADGARHM
tara:strand:- start:1895 stop:1999 length:105 start_codon:yes stop_codon:yes gene_type:complete